MINEIEFTLFSEEKPSPELLGEQFIVLDQDECVEVVYFEKITEGAYYFARHEHFEDIEVINPQKWACLKHGH